MRIGQLGAPAWRAPARWPHLSRSPPQSAAGERVEAQRACCLTCLGGAEGVLLDLLGTRRRCVLLGWLGARSSSPPSQTKCWQPHSERPALDPPKPRCERLAPNPLQLHLAGKPRPAGDKISTERKKGSRLSKHQPTGSNQTVRSSTGAHLEHLAPNLLELHLAAAELQAQLHAVALAQELLRRLDLDLRGREAQTRLLRCASRIWRLWLLLPESVCAALTLTCAAAAAAGGGRTRVSGLLLRWASTLWGSRLAFDASNQRQCRQRHAAQATW